MNIRLARMGSLGEDCSIHPRLARSIGSGLDYLRLVVVPPVIYYPIRVLLGVELVADHDIVISPSPDDPAARGQAMGIDDPWRWRRCRRAEIAGWGPERPRVWSQGRSLARFYDSRLNRHLGSKPRGV